VLPSRVLLGAAVLVTACGGQSAAQGLTPQLEAVVQAARADAAQRPGVKAGDLTLILAEYVTWSDGSLGCPRPGQLYTQSLVPGYRVKLQVGSEVFDYHASERGGLVLCPPGLSEQPAPDSRT
jgi:hypothetical protein